MRQLVRLALLLGLAGMTQPLTAQLAPLGAPKGTLRFDLQGAFESADRRLLGGQGEDYLSDFGSAALGSDRFPLLKSADSILGSILGQSGYRLNLGRTTANGQLTVGTGTIGAALGITRRLTLFGHIPLVTTRVQAKVAVDSGSGDGGLNGAHPTLGNSIDQGNAAQFFADFATALTTLDSRIASGAYSGNPALDAQARALSARAAALRLGLETITTGPLTAAVVLPTSGSAAGTAIVAAIIALQDTLSTTLGVSGFSGTPVLAGTDFTTADLNGLLTDPFSPIAALPLAEAKIARMGDMDVGAIYTVIDRFDQQGTTGGFRLAVQGLLRLPTGQRDNPNNLLDVGTGNGRYEVGLSGTADFGRGNLGVRMSGGYLLRLPSLRVRRVGVLGAPFVEVSHLKNVRYNAGDIAQLSVQPFFRLARSFALHFEADWARQGSDAVSYYSSTDSIPGVDASVLGRNSSATSLALGVGVTYVGRALRECDPGRRCGFPIDASWSYTNVFAGSGGRVPQFRVTRVEIRWYQRIWR
ncbi:MAG: hypothetical protein ABI587_07010 [Gemmatimonadales bacterium]